MWLYTINVWWAARKNEYSREYSHISERAESRVYRGADVNEGLALMGEYIQTMKAKYKTAVSEYRILGITSLPEETDVELLSNLGCHEISRASVDAAGSD